MRYAVKTGDQSLIVNYTAERQTPFNPDATRILGEKSFLSLSEAGQGNCTRYKMKLQVANLVVFYTPLHDAGYTNAMDAIETTIHLLIVQSEQMTLRGGRTLHAPIHKGSNVGTGLRKLAGSSVTTHRSSSQPEPDPNSTG